MSTVYNNQAFYKECSETATKAKQYEQDQKRLHKKEWKEAQGAQSDITHFEGHLSMLTATIAASTLLASAFADEGIKNALQLVGQIAVPKFGESLQQYQQSQMIEEQFEAQSSQGEMQIAKEESSTLTNLILQAQQKEQELLAQQAAKLYSLSVR